MSSVDSISKLGQAASHGVGDDCFHHVAQFGNLLLIVKECRHDRLHVICWAPLVELFPVHKEVRGFHVNGEAEVCCVSGGSVSASIAVELVAVADDDSASTRIWHGY